MTQKITFDAQLLGLMSLFEKITKSKIKDSFYDRDKLVFLVFSGELKKALGKNKTNITKLEKLFKKKIKIVEFSDDRMKFIKNYLAPLKIEEIKEEGDIITITGPDTKTKGLMIGAKAQNLRNLENIVKKYFPLEEIKIV